MNVLIVDDNDMSLYPFAINLFRGLTKGTLFSGVVSGGEGGRGGGKNISLKLCSYHLSVNPIRGSSVQN